MRVCIVHNFYVHRGGEDTVVENLCSLLADHGHVVIPFFRHSNEIAGMVCGEVRAFFGGIYSYSSKKAMCAILATYQPDVVHVHNLFPLISPSVLRACHQASVPVVMTLHNYRLSCPHGVHMIDGQICERCQGGREYWCLLRNCEGSIPKSLGYAVRGLIARTLRFYADSIATYVVLTQFHQSRLLSEGIASDRVVVLPNTVTPEATVVSSSLGDYVAFVGRISPEKGIHTLLAAAERLPHIPFQLAGACGITSPPLHHVPSNLRLLGFLNREMVPAFILGSRLTVLCSTWFEGFPIVVVETMMAGKPIVASRIGGIPEIVDDHVTGLLAKPGDAEDLADKIHYLWDRPGLCQQMGQAGREKALREYSPQQYYDRLLAVYKKAVTLGPPERSRETNQAATELPSCEDGG